MEGRKELEMRLAELAAEQEAITFGAEAPRTPGFLDHLKFLRSEYNAAVAVLLSVDPTDSIEITRQQQRGNMILAQLDYFNSATERSNEISAEIASISVKLKTIEKGKKEPGTFVPGELAQEIEPDREEKDHE